MNIAIHSGEMIQTITALTELVAMRTATFRAIATPPEPGPIINVSTLAAVQGFHRGSVGFAAYSATKVGLIGLK